jgi:uncharacterized membrane protein (DUF373 family)
MPDVPPAVSESTLPQVGCPLEAKTVPHTQVHATLRRTLELLQDVVAFLLMLVLLFVSVQTLWGLARMAFLGEARANEMLSEIISVLILMELYRLMIFYIREHRVSVALTVEVALISMLQEVMLKGPHGYEWLQIVGIALLLSVLGGILALERWMTHWRKEIRETDAR